MSKEINFEEELKAIESEQGPAKVGGEKRRLAPGMRVLLVTGVVVVGALGVAGTWWAHSHKEEAKAKKPAKVANVLPAAPVVQPPVQEVEPVVPEAKQVEIAYNTTPEKTIERSSVSPAAKPEKTAAELRKERILAGGLGSGSASTSSDVAAAATKVAAVDIEAPAPGSPYKKKVKAQHLGNRDFLLTQGAMIYYVLETKVDTTIVPGVVKAYVTADVWSDNNRVLLVRKGSELIGFYPEGLKQGQARILPIWSRLKMSDGAVVNFSVPGTDAMGGMGMPGQVNNHWWERIGGAVLLAVIQDSLRNLTASAGGGGSNNNIQLGSVTSTGESLARDVLRNTIDIPPTLYANQGERGAAFLTSDIDFSEVYELALN